QAIRRPSRRAGEIPRDDHLGVLAADPRAPAARRRVRDLGRIPRRERGPLRVEAVDPRALLPDGDAAVRRRAARLRPAEPRQMKRPLPRERAFGQHLRSLISVQSTPRAAEPTSSAAWWPPAAAPFAALIVTVTVVDAPG